jgi:hypothetical protein
MSQGRIKRKKKCNSWNYIWIKMFWIGPKNLMSGLAYLGVELSLIWCWLNVTCSCPTAIEVGPSMTADIRIIDIYCQLWLLSHCSDSHWCCRYTLMVLASHWGLHRPGHRSVSIGFMQKKHKIDTTSTV